MIRLDQLVGRVDRVEISCNRCPRRGRYAVGRLRREHGDIALFDLLLLVSADCPRRQVADYNAPHRLYERCGVRCPTLSTLAL